MYSIFFFHCVENAAIVFAQCLKFILCVKLQNDFLDLDDLSLGFNSPLKGSQLASSSSELTLIIHA